MNPPNRPEKPNKAALVAIVAALYAVLSVSSFPSAGIAKPEANTTQKTSTSQPSSTKTLEQQLSAQSSPAGQSLEKRKQTDPPASVKTNAPASDTNGGDTVFGGSSIDEEMVIGKVLTVTRPKINKELYAHTGMVSEHQVVRVQVLEGELKGKEFVVPHELTDNPAFNVAVNPGQEVVLAVVPGQDGKLEVSICDYHRAPILYGLLIIFLIAFLALGGKKGFKSLVGLVVTVLLIGYILLPLSLKGYNPLYTAVGICFLAGTTSIILIGGVSKKSLSAIIGTVGGVIIAGLAARIVIELAPLNGLSSEEAQILRGSVLVQQMPFYSGLLAAGMLIGALGVIMDVAISIASTVAEVAKTDSKLTTKQLYESGMNVGRDIMGTMTNTLILAYAGSALPLLLLATQMPSIKLLNLDLFATEVASALSGSLGLTLTIPLTALAAARLMSGSEKQK